MMNTRIFISESVIYKRSWWEWLRRKVFANGGFLRESRSCLLYTENVGRYCTLFIMDSTPQRLLYDVMVGGELYDVMVGGDSKYRLPPWMVTLTK